MSPKRHSISKVSVPSFRGVEIRQRLNYLLVVNPAMASIDHKTCFKCSYEADTAETRCPRCGKAFKSSTNLRVRGGILVFVGAFLILFMGAIASFVGYLVAKGGMPGRVSRFTGTRNDLILIFGVFGFVILFGFVSLANGVWQLIYGRRNQPLTWAMFALVFFLIIGGTMISFFLP